jgi:hypothetical protein
VGKPVSSTLGCVWFSPFTWSCTRNLRVTLLTRSVLPHTSCTQAESHAASTERKPLTSALELPTTRANMSLTRWRSAASVMVV